MARLDYATCTHSRTLQVDLIVDVLPDAIIFVLLSKQGKLVAPIDPSKPNP